MSTWRQREGRRKTINKKIKEYLALGGDFFRVLHEPLHEFDKEERADVLGYVLHSILELDFVPPDSDGGRDSDSQGFEDFRKFVLERVNELE